MESLHHQSVQSPRLFVASTSEEVLGCIRDDASFSPKRPSQVGCWVVGWDDSLDTSLLAVRAESITEPCQARAGNKFNVKVEALAFGTSITKSTFLLTSYLMAQAPLPPAPISEMVGEEGIVLGLGMFRFGCMEH